MADLSWTPTLERLLTDREAAFTGWLAANDPSWGSVAFTVGGGTAVLSGPGLYVNRLFAAGLDADVPSAELVRFERRCAECGVAPSVQVLSTTEPSFVERLSHRGYVESDRIALLLRPLDDDVMSRSAPGFELRAVDDSSLPSWQQVSAAGWGHVGDEARRASDAYAAAAMAVDFPGLMLAIDPAGGLVVGATSLAIHGGVAVLGGTSVLPEHRGRGVQTDMIRLRLALAASLGGTVAVATAESDGGSERNLLRAGFHRADEATVLTLVA